MTDLIEEMLLTPTTFDDDSPYRCETCGKSLTYGGRGRKPRFCDEHKRGGAKTPRPTQSLRALEDSLTEIYLGIGMAVTWVDEEDGMIVTRSANALAHSWIVLAESDPKVKRFLQKVTQGSGWGAVLIAHGMVAYPIWMNHNMAKSKQTDFTGG